MVILTKYFLAIVILLTFAIFVVVDCYAQEETESYSLIADKDVGYGADISFLTWHGYLNFEFDNTLDNPNSNSNFDNHEFYLSARSDISERVSLTAEFEYEHTPEKLILPIQAFADLKVSPLLTFRVGMFYTPMGISRSYNLRGNKNRMIRQVALTHDIMFENWSEVGLNFFGEHSSGLFYDFAIGNGMRNTMANGDSWFDGKDDLQSHSEDNNDNKAIHSRFGYHGDMNGEFTVGISFGTQKYDAAEELEMTHMGFDIRYLHDSGIRLQAEFMSRDGDNHPELYTATGIAAKATGWYGQLSKRFYGNNNEWLNFWEPVIQIDFIDLDTDIDSGVNSDITTPKDLTTIAIGLNYSPEPFYYVKFEYDMVTGNEDTEVFDKVWVSIVVEF